MTPTFTTFNSANGVFTNSMLNRYFSLQTVVLKNFQHYFFGKFRCRALFSTIGCSVFNSVSLIVGRSIPTKIINEVVQWIAIVMAAFHSSLRITLKSAENNSANPAKFIFILSPQKDRRAAIFFINGRLFNLSSFYCTDASLVRNFIQILKSWDWFPFFKHRKITVTVDMGIIAYGT